MHPSTTAGPTGHALRGASALRASCCLVLCAALVLAWSSTAHAQGEDTLLWVEMRGGMGFFNDIDPDPLEELATELSSRRGSITTFEPVEFVDKEWAFPFDVRVGMRLGDSTNFWLFYERLPYLLENDFESRTGPLRPDTATLNIPANVFGAGFDFRLGTEGYGKSIILGFGAGRFEAKGDDEDVQGLQNFAVNASGLFWEIQAMAEFQFTTEMSFLPFVAFRSAKTDEASARPFLRPDGRNLREYDIPEFGIDYTGVTVGLAVRFRVYPFDVVGDPDRGDDD